MRYRELVLDAEGVYKTRVWTKTPAEHLTISAHEEWRPGEWITPVRRGTPLNLNPFTFIGPSEITPVVETPPLLPLVDVNLLHYRNRADRQHGLFYTALPTVWVSGGRSSI